MKIYIIRHGETELNKEGRLQGWIDEPLNALGVRLAEETGRALGREGVHFDACISSPLQRAVRTAEILLRESGNTETPITTDDRLRELGMGVLDGKSIDPAAGEVDPGHLHFLFHDPWNMTAPEGGEDTQQVVERTQAFLRELAALDDDRTYLVSMHGFALRAMLNCLYEDPQDFYHGHVPYNCVINIVESRNGQMKLVADDRLYYDPSEAIDRYAV